MIAIISDIHNNIEALDAVFLDIDKRGIEEVICLGDIVGYGPNPRECIKQIMTRCRAIKGNHEEGVLFYAEDFNDRARRAIEWTRDQINGTQFDKEENALLWDFLGNLGTELREEDALFVHASPRDPIREYVFPDEVGDFRKFDEIFDMFERVCFVGHTHIPGVFTQEYRFVWPQDTDYYFKIPENGKYLVNVGSTGQPRDFDTRASYAIYDGDSVEFVRIEYDFRKTMKKIIDEPGLPNFQAERLERGR